MVESLTTLLFETATPYKLVIFVKQHDLMRK